MVALVRGRVPWIAAALTLAVAAGAVSLALLSGGAGVERLLPSGQAISVSGSVAPREVLFGDTVRAQWDVRFDRRLIDPSRVAVRWTAEPFGRVGDPVTRTRTVGEVTQIVTTTTLRCLVDRCLITGGRRAMRLREAELSFARRGRRAQSRTFAFPSVLVGSRLGPRDAQINTLNPILPRWRAPLRTLPPPSYAFSPVTGSLVLAGAAGLLLLAAAALVYRLLPEEWRSFGRRRPPLPPLERALALLEQARREGRERDERKALDLLARELRERDAPELAGAARELAWRRAAPPARASEELAREVRALLNWRSNGRRA